MVHRRHARSGVVSISFVLLLLLSMIPLLASPVLAAAPRTAEAQQAIDWLRTQQMSDGGFAAFSETSDASVTAEVVYALAAMNIDPRSFTSAAGNDPIDFLLTAAAGEIGNPGRAAKVGLALHAASVNVRDAGGVDLIQAIEGGFIPETGWYGASFFGHLYAVLLLHAEGVPVPEAAIDAILAAQTPDGSWGFTGEPIEGSGDSNTTALAIQTLVAVGADRAAIDAGLSYLAGLQDENGAIPYDAASGAGDANSTALAIQAFTAAGIDVDALPTGSLLTALLRFQNESGAFQFQPAYPEDSLLATTQAIPALLLKPFPIDPVALDSPAREAARPAQPIDGCDYHGVTQHNVCGIFRDMWHAGGGLAIFGYALTEPFELHGMRVQYFERARFEWHPDLAGTPYEVLLTRLGADEIEMGYRERTPRAEPLPDCAWHEVTGHNVCGPIAEYWDIYGGLPIFGYPLTEPFEENGATVQYFERARFEYRPGSWPERLDILLGRLGAEALERELAR